MKGGSGFNTIYDSLDLLDNHWIVMDHGLLWPRLQVKDDEASAQEFVRFLVIQLVFCNSFLILQDFQNLRCQGFIQLVKNESI